MCDICRQKADHMAKLARFFREAAAETRQAAYRRLMIGAAADLDRLCCCQLAECQRVQASVESGPVTTSTGRAAAGGRMAA